MQADIIIKNAYILTVDQNNTEIPFGFIVIKGDKIIEIGSGEPDLNIEASTIIDAQGNLVMPGLINAHTHVPMTIFRGMADDLPLQEWLNEYIFPAEAEFINANNVRIGSELGILEMIRSGTTCFADMYYFEDIVADVCEKIGIRCLLSEGILDFPVPNNPTADSAIANTRKLLEKYKESDLINISVGPHSPYTCGSDNLKKARALANEYNVPLHTHVSETAWEYDKFLSDYKKTPIQYLHDEGILEGKTIAAHMVFASESDIELMLKKDVGVATNPICNMKLSSGVAPVPAYLQRGLLVGLGTDGVVSNNNLDMFEEMKVLSILHKQHNTNPSLLTAREAIRMATIEGAKLLGLQDLIGSIETEKKADLIMININQPHLTPLYNIESQIVYSATGRDVDTVIINGQIIMQNKEITKVDEMQVMIEAQTIALTVAEYLSQKKNQQ